MDFPTLKKKSMKRRNRGLKYIFFTFIFVIAPKDKWMMLMASLFMDVFCGIIFPLILFRESMFSIPGVVCLSIPVLALNVSTAVSFCVKEKSAELFYSKLR